MTTNVAEICREQVNFLLSSPDQHFMTLFTKTLCSLYRVIQKISSYRMISIYCYTRPKYQCAWSYNMDKISIRCNLKKPKKGKDGIWRN